MTASQDWSPVVSQRSSVGSIDSFCVDNSQPVVVDLTDSETDSQVSALSHFLSLLFSFSLLLPLSPSLSILPYRSLCLLLSLLSLSPSLSLSLSPLLLSPLSPSPSLRLSLFFPLCLLLYLSSSISLSLSLLPLSLCLSVSLYLLLFQFSASIRVSVFTPSGLGIHKIIENCRWRFWKKKRKKNFFWLLNGNLSILVKSRILICESLFRCG